MKPSFKWVFTAWVVFTLSCATPIPDYDSPETIESAKRDMPAYIVDKNIFFGYELYSEYKPSEFAKGYGHKVFKDMLVFDDKPNLGPFGKVYITITRSENKIVKLHFENTLNSDFEALSFYRAVMQQLQKNYPRDVVKTRNDGSNYIRCTPSEKQWISGYSLYLVGSGHEYFPNCIHPNIQEIILVKKEKSVSLIYATYEMYLAYDMLEYKSGKGLEGI